MEQDKDQAQRIFKVDGALCTLHALCVANKDDDDLKAWAHEAKVGDFFPAHVECVRVQ